jgi:hypothetical protein
MKVLRAHDLPRDEDGFSFSLEGTFDPGGPLERELEPCLQALEEYASGWMPDVVKGKRYRKYSRAAIWKGLEEERDGNSTDVGLYRTQWPALDMTLRIAFPPRTPELYLYVRMQPLNPFEDEARCRRFVDLVHAWARRYPVTYARAHSAADGQLADWPRFGRDVRTSMRDGFDKVYEVFWLNVFGPKLVEAIGRERVLSTPAHRVEVLPNGAVLLVLWPTAAGFASDEARLAQARAHAHLRPDLDFDTLLRTLRERSAALAPVEPRFPPDLAPLLSRIVDFAHISERQRRIADFNAWQPPEPDEWLPAHASLLPDVTDPAAALEHYADLAETLVAIMHTHVPTVFETSPPSLTDLDFRFWREEFPRIFAGRKVDEHAVPAVGAYLGEVLVKHLGGEWIPRRKLEETGVRVGGRVWLPFVRAWRYMRSCQALLDYSLTGLYRAAERHRG